MARVTLGKGLQMITIKIEVYRDGDLLHSHEGLATECFMLKLTPESYIFSTGDGNWVPGKGIGGYIFKGYKLTTHIEDWHE